MFRYSIRLALAMMAGAVVAQFLGDSGHGNWVLLTIAVIMRSNYGMTRSRRDDRVIGTLIGCVVAAGAVAWLPARTLVAAQGLAVVVIHSFVKLNYRLSSVGASVMALVSLHLIQPHLPAPVLARLADTLIGAAIAHLFSFVWPYWEFSDAPGIARRLQARLAAFADVALNAAAPVQDYRLARKNVIEAIAALSDSAGRMSVEPVAARKGLEEMAALLMAAHGFTAQALGGAARHPVRAARAGRRASRGWLQRRLDAKPVEAHSAAPPRPGRLPRPPKPWSRPRSAIRRRRRASWPDRNRAPARRRIKKRIKKPRLHMTLREVLTRSAARNRALRGDVNGLGLHAEDNPYGLLDFHYPATRRFVISTPRL